MCGTLSGGRRERAQQMLSDLHMLKMKLSFFQQMKKASLHESEEDLRAERAEALKG